MTSTGRFLVGINYWPRETAMFWWRRFDLACVRRDFSLLADFGFDLVRIFLLWEDFQPEIRRVSVSCLDRLVQVAETAHESRIKILPTFFTGYMSGMNWLPPWMLESSGEKGRFSIFSDGQVLQAGIRNMYGEKEVLKAQKLLLHETTGALQGHPAVWGYDLGNEPLNLVIPPSKDRARAWLEEMVLELKRYDSDIPVTLGLGQQDLEEDRVLGPGEVASACDLLAVHAYPCYAAWAEGPLDWRASLFVALLASWLGGKKVLLEGFGVPTDPGRTALPEEERERLGGVELVPEEDAALYYGKVLEVLSAYGFPGGMAWCFSDFEPRLWEVSPLREHVHERYFGLFRWDGSPKEGAGRIAGAGRGPASTEASLDWIDLRPDDYYERPGEHLERLYQRFKERFQEV
ncbi:MAG: hypothetical protein JRH07_17105 [Deltaproteobacteria bacterium]|nr:hypothetical protein [Deltaproteobacteria bacterium]